VPRVNHKVKNHRGGAQRRATRQSGNRVVRDELRGRRQEASEPRIAAIAAWRYGEQVEPERSAIEAAQLERADRWRRRRVMQSLSGEKRFQLCGKRAHGRGDGGVRVTLSAATGMASYRGVQTCGSVWACSVCQHNIRRRRAEEVRSALIEHVKRGGGLIFGTLTVRHFQRDTLQRGFDGVAGSWKSVQQNKAVREFRKAYPFGFIRAIEVLDGGDNGWHPHMHLVILTDAEWSDDVRESLSALVHAEWVKAAKRITGRSPDALHGTLFEQAKSPQDAAEYLCKLQEDAREWDAAAELTMSHRKEARKRGGSFHPLTLLDMAEQGDKRAIARWHEYVETTSGRRCLTWSHGLRKRLLVDEPELTDEELAEDLDAEQSEIVGYLLPRDFMAVRRAKLMLTMLSAVERDGLAGFWTVLERARVIGDRKGWFDPPAQPWAC
jgi:hypothetical protein